MSISDVERVSNLWNRLEKHENTPIAGVTLINTWPVLFDSAILASLTEMADAALPLVPGTLFLGMAVRGLAWASKLAEHCRGSMIPVTKSVKLPADCVLSAPYTCEYGAGVQQLPLDLLPKPSGNTIWPAYIVDDLVATGGSVRAVIELLKSQPHIRVVGVIALIEFPNHRLDVPVHSVFRCTPTAEYLGVGSLYHSWLPIVDRTRCEALPRSLGFNFESVVHFYSPRMQHLRSASQIWRPIPLERFADGVLNGRFVPDLNGVEAHVHLDMTDRKNLVDSIAFCNILPDQGIASLDIHIRFYPDGTMERVDEEGVVASAQTIARMFRNIPLTPSGRTKLRITDLHALASRFYFDADNVQVVMESVQEPIIRNPTQFGPAPVVVFPDAGAAKRYAFVLQNIPTIVFDKIRNGEKRSVSVHEVKNSCDSVEQLVASAPGFILVDDISRTFGTVLETLRAMQALGAKENSVLVSLANIDPPGDQAIRFFGNAPPCFQQICVSMGTRAAYQLFTHPLFKKRVYSVDSGYAIRFQPDSVVGSLNPSKQCGARFAVCVPSGVPNQPDFDLAKEGARNRMRAAFEIASKQFAVDWAVGPESGIAITTKWYDISCIALTIREKDRTTEHENSVITHGNAVVPDEFHRPSVVGSKTFGELMREKYNLVSNDAWIEWMGGDRKETFKNLTRIYTAGRNTDSNF